MEARITSVEFRNFKAFGRFSVALRPMSVLVGPNNSGKSTVIGAFRALGAGLRLARAKRPELVTGPDGLAPGHSIPEDSLPISLENVHTEYAVVDTTVRFRLSNRPRRPAASSASRRGAAPASLLPATGPHRRRPAAPTRAPELAAERLVDRRGRTAFGALGAQARRSVHFTHAYAWGSLESQGGSNPDTVASSKGAGR